MASYTETAQAQRVTKRSSGDGLHRTQAQVLRGRGGGGGGQLGHALGRLPGRLEAGGLPECWYKAGELQVPEWQELAKDRRKWRKMLKSIKIRR
jgi:hypothetical protein